MNRLKRMLQRLSISKRLFVFTALSLTLFVSLLLFVAQQIASARIEHTYMTNTEDLQDAMSEGIKLFVADMGMLSFRVQNDNPLFECLRDESRSYEDRLSAYRDRLEALADWSMVADIVVVDSRGETYTSGKTAFTGQPDFFTVEEITNSGQGLWINAVEKDRDGTAYVRFGYPYHHTVYGWNGAIFIYVPETALYNAYEGAAGQHGRSLLVTGDGLILAAREKEKVGSTLFDHTILDSKSFHHLRLPYNGEDSFYFSKAVNAELCDLRMLTILPRSVLYNSLHRMNVIVLCLEAGVVLLAFGLSFLISRRVVGPIRRLRDKLDAFGSDRKLKPEFLKDSGDELQALEDTYNAMIARITELVNANLEEKVEQRRLQLTALQAQINPHFLYNTLDTIVWMAKIKKQKDIEDIAMALAGFFRFSLHKGDKYMQVREELAFVRDFVRIQQIRFPDKFDVQYQVDEELMDCRILKMTIQPFVENAIKHGIGPKAGKGHIIIRGYKESAYLLFEIRDDGVGFSEKEKAGTAGELGSLSGYGVQNVDERLRLEYGEDCGVTMEGTPGVGTRVILRMGYDHREEKPHPALSPLPEQTGGPAPAAPHS